MDMTDTQSLTLEAKARDGKVTIRTEIPVSGEAEDYLVTITVAPIRSEISDVPVCSHARPPLRRAGGYAAT
jgi:hypothetical protein